MKRLIICVCRRVLPLIGLGAAVFMGHSTVVHSADIDHDGLHRIVGIENSVSKTLKSIDGAWEYTEESPWYSQIQYGEGLELRYTIESNIKPSNLALRRNGEAVEAEVDDTGWESENITLVSCTIDGSRDQDSLYILEYDLDDKHYEEAFPVKIDSTSPGKNIEVTIQEDEKIIDVSEYADKVLPEAYYSNESLSLEYHIQDQSSDGSDLSEITFGIKTEDSNKGTSFQETTINLEKEENEAGYKAVLDLPMFFQEEKIVSIDNIIIRDVAGNVEEIDATSEAYPRLFVQDTKAPVITYCDMMPYDPQSDKVKDNTTRLNGRTVGDVLYTSDSVTGIVTAGDGNLILPGGFACEIETDEPDLLQEESLMLDNDNNTACYKVSREGRYNIVATATDICRNNTGKVYGPEIVIDRTAPEISVSYEKMGKGGTFIPHGEDTTYIAEAVKMHIEIKDKNIDIKDVATNISSVSGDIDVEYQQTEDGYASDIYLQEDGEYRAEIVAKDMALNEASYTGEGFTIDTTAPVAKILFDNEDYENEKYFSRNRIATITVEDMTFDETASILDIHADCEPNADPVWIREGEKGSNGVYSRHITFNEDGAYSLRFTAVDKAGNRAEVIDVPEFIIDKQIPQISVRYDNDKAINSKYYNQKRTATVTIKDDSFDRRNVKIEPIKETGTSVGESFYDFVQVDQNTYEATISFTEDGRYGYTIKCMDLAGNISEPYIQPEFIIDMTEPELEITGVTDHSANNGTVQIAARYGDINIDNSHSNIFIHGIKNGNINLQGAISKEGDIYTIQFADFPVQKEFDDLYVMEAHITDMAGNEANNTLCFSVNRFGSVYSIDPQTMSIIEEYYLNEPFPITLMEVNVDEIVEKQILVTRDGKRLKLKEGRDYAVSRQGGSEGWNAYYYTIKPEFFKKDGNYQITLFSKDKASNEADSGTSGQLIQFALDTTSPSVVVSGMDSGKTYYEKEHEVGINVTDNLGLSEVVVTADNEELARITEEGLKECGGYIRLKIPQSEKARTVTILAKDMASNVEEITYSGVVINPDKEAADAMQTDIADAIDVRAYMVITALILCVIGVALIGVRRKNA